jgi:hypothetical protein
MDVGDLQNRSTAPAHSALGWAAAILSMLLWLGGCSGPTSIANLRRHAAYVYSVEVPAACEIVYLRIARRAQER